MTRRPLVPSPTAPPPPLARSPGARGGDRRSTSRRAPRWPTMSTVLVLDNFEQVLGAAADVAALLSAAAPGARCPRDEPRTAPRLPPSTSMRCRRSTCRTPATRPPARSSGSQRCASMRSARAPRSASSSSPTPTQLRWRGSAGRSTAFPWRSSSLRRASERSAPRELPIGSASGSRSVPRCPRPARAAAIAPRDARLERAAPGSGGTRPAHRARRLQRRRLARRARARRG